MDIRKVILGRVKTGSSLVEYSILSCMAVSLAMSVGHGYSNMLKKSLMTTDDLISSEQKSRTIIETYRVINGRIISDKREEMVNYVRSV